MRPISIRLTALLRAVLPVALIPDEGRPLDWSLLSELAEAVCSSGPDRRSAARAFADHVFRQTPALDESSGKSVRALYEHAAQAVIPDWAPGLETNLDVDSSGHMTVWLRFDAEALDPGSLEEAALDSLFEVLASFIEQMPTLVGEPAAEARLRRWPGQAVATVELPNPLERLESRLVAADRIGGAALDDLADGFLELGSDGRIYAINEAVLRSAGLPREHFQSRTLDELVAARDRSRVLGQLADACATGRPALVSFRSFGTTTGQALELEASISPFQQEDGSRRAVAIVRDVGHRVAREQAAVDRSSHYLAMIEAGQDIALELDAAGETVYCHVSIEGFDEIPHDANFSRELFARVEPDYKSTASDAFHSVRQDRASHHFDVKIRTDTGALRWFTVRFQAIEDGVAARMWDITHRKEYEDALRAIAETAFDSGSFLDSMVGHMARALGFECALVATPVEGAPGSAHTLAIWNDGGLGDDLELSIEGTALREVLEGRTCIYPEGLAHRFPSQLQLGSGSEEGSYEAFLGAPLYDERNNVAGCIAALSRHPIANPDLARSTLAIFAERATAELQRAAASFAHRESEERLRAVIEQTPDLIIDADSERGVQYVSPSFRQILGYAPGEIDFLDLLPDDERDDVIERFEAAFTHETPENGLVRLHDRDGKWHWFDTTSRAYDGTNGDRRLVIIARDVTQEHLAEHERLQLTALMQQSSDLMMLSSLSGELLFLNSAGRQLLGTVDESAPADVFDFFAGGNGDLVRHTIIPALSRDRSWTGELQLQPVDTSESISVAASLFILTDERSSRPAALALICRDLREKHRAAQELNEATARLALLADSSFDLIAEVDENANFIFVSANYETVLGYKPEDLIGTSALELTPAEERPLLRADFDTMIASGESRVTQLTCFDAAGTPHPAEVTLIGYRSASGKRHALIVMRDLTESSEAERKLKESEERLRQSQKMEAIGRLAGGIAHDFNNLLTAITGHTDLLIEDLGKDHPSLPDAREVLNASTRASALTRQLLAFSRRQVLQVRTVDLNALVSGIDRMLRRVIGEEYRFVSCLDGSLWPATADEGQIEQVLLNLVVNARDAMPIGGEIQVETENVTFGENCEGQQGTIPAGDYASLTVTDSGQGMGEDTLARVFEPFFTTKPAGEGTGLGLSTVLGIVQQSGGYVQVESRAGRGSSFQVLLPRAAEMALETEAAESLSTAPADAVVLVLEDEHAVRALVARHLSERGYEVLEASHAEAALEHCRQRDDIDLLLTDVVLQGLDGPTVAEHIVAMHPATRVAFMSGFTDDALERHGLDAREIALLQKPFTRAALLRCVEKALASDAETDLSASEDSD